MSSALEALQRYLPETDPEPTWRAAFSAACDRYDFLKWPAYGASFLICSTLFFGLAVLLASQPHHIEITVRSASWGGLYDAFALRVLMWFMPWFPWPPWFREFRDLLDALAPFERVIRRKNGEPDPDVT